MLAGWLISSKLGRGLQGLLEHFQMGALTPGLLDAQFPWGSILPERMSLYTDVQGMVQPRCPGRMAVPPGSLLGICCPSSASAAHASSHTPTSSGHIKSRGHQQVQNNTAELSSETFPCTQMRLCSLEAGCGVASKKPRISAKPPPGLPVDSLEMPGLFLGVFGEPFWGGEQSLRKG